MSNTVDVHHQEADTLRKHLKMIDFSLWESRNKAVNAFISYYSFDITDFVFISVFGFFLVILSLLGFGFYLWYLKTGNEHTQSRILNILYGYLSALCMTFSPAVFILILQQQIDNTKIYSKDVLMMNSWKENK